MSSFIRFVFVFGLGGTRLIESSSVNRRFIESHEVDRRGIRACKGSGGHIGGVPRYAKPYQGYRKYEEPFVHKMHQVTMVSVMVGCVSLTLVKCQNG